MKRLITVLTAILFIMSLSACRRQKALSTPDSTSAVVDNTNEDDGSYTLIDLPEFPQHSAYEPLCTPYSYLNLSEESGLREVYDALYDAVFYLSDRESFDYDDLYAIKPITLSGVYTEQQVESALVSVQDDHPELFWITSDITADADSATNSTTVRLNSSYSPDQVSKMIPRLSERFTAFYAGIPDDLPLYEREKYVYQYLIDHCTYDDQVDESEDYGWEHPSIYDIYGVMVEGLAVCEGYSRAFDYLCSQLGIDTVTVGGIFDDDEENLHSWNAVKLDGEWYWTDVTWDDWDDDAEEGDILLYLNLDDDSMMQDHESFLTYDQYSADAYEALTYSVNTYVPKCEGTKYSYLLKESVHLTDVDSDELYLGMVKAAETKQELLLVYVDPAYYTISKAEDALFDGDQPYYLSLDKANEKLFDTQLDSESDAVYYTYPERNILAFELNYL